MYLMTRTSMTHYLSVLNTCEYAPSAAEAYARHISTYLREESQLPNSSSCAEMGSAYITVK
jgi:hypothetical protein